jgi:DNA polymerase-3 subunit alpha
MLNFCGGKVRFTGEKVMVAANSVPDFCHLHVHTEYSLLDGASKIHPLVKHAHNLKQKALAITDHGNMFGAIEFYQACRELTKKAEAEGKPGIKPLIGTEAYIVPEGRSRHTREKVGGEAGCHLVLLARDLEGWQNLLKLASLGYTEGFYYNARIDREILGRYAKGLIGLSACLAGEIPMVLRRGDQARAKEIAGIYQDLLGAENFYLELQDHRLEEQRKLNPQLIRLAAEIGAKLVATNDSHYTDRSDAKAHDALLCIGTKKTINDAQRMRFETEEFYLKSGAEMWSLFAECPEALKNTMEVAERCDLKLKFGAYHYPLFPVPDGKSLSAYFREQVEDGLRRRYGGEIPATVRTRADEEMRVLIKMGFDGYLLIVWDIISESRRRGIPVGPGRGSAAGSIVCYALGITNLDPLQYQLLFERFVNEGRNEMPDIDVDICQQRREEVLTYVQDRYGRDRTAGIITFGSMLSKGAVRDIGRVLDYPLPDVDALAKLIPGGPQKVSLAPKDPDHPNVLYVIDEVPELREKYETDSRAHELIDLARRIEGVVRNPGRHAAGMVVADKPLTEYCPLYRDKEGALLTQFEMAHIDAVGLLKIDLLGLETLTVIDLAKKLIRETTGKDVDLDKLPLDDPATFRLLAGGGAKGVFQFESDGMQRMLQESRPDRLDDLIALNAMYRPGPIDNIPSFVSRKHGREKIEYLVPQLEPILRETYGIIVYQEQVMRIAHELGGFTLSEADSLRKAMGKKKKDLMEKYSTLFIEGCQKHGIPREKAERLFELIERFASYGFNKSHAAAYAFVAYQTAWLKTHYPAQFMAALLSLKQDKTEKLVEYIDEARRLGLRIEAPDVNRSGLGFLPLGSGRLSYSLSAIKGVGEKAAEVIVKGRASGPYRDLYDFSERVDARLVNKGVVESLVRSGAFDGIAGKDAGRGQLFAAVEDALSCGTRSREDRLSGQGMLFGGDESGTAPPPLPRVADWLPKEKLEEEKKALGFYFSGHPLDRVRELVESLSSCSSRKLAALPENREVVFGGFVTQVQKKTTRADKKQMAILTLEGILGPVTAVVFPRTYEKFQRLLVPDTVLFVRGKTKADQRGGSVSRPNGTETGEAEQPDAAPVVTLLTDELFSLEEAVARFAESVTVRLNGEGVDEVLATANGNGAGEGKKEAASKKSAPDLMQLIESRAASVLDLARAHPGKLPLFLKVEMDEVNGARTIVCVRTQDKLKISPTENFVSGLRHILRPGAFYFSASGNRVQKAAEPPWKRRN